MKNSVITYPSTDSIGLLVGKICFCDWENDDDDQWDPTVYNRERMNIVLPTSVLVKPELKIVCPHKM